MFNYRHPSPRRECQGLRAAGHAPLPAGKPRVRRANHRQTTEFREAIFYTQASQTLQISTGKDVHFRTKVTPSVPWEPKVPQRGPPASKGSQWEFKVTQRRAPWDPWKPKAPQRVPKGSPKSFQEKQNEFQRHPKETNKSQSYIHTNETYTNSRSTAIQPAASILLNIHYDMSSSLIFVIVIIALYK